MKGIPNIALSWVVGILALGVFLQVALLSHSVIQQAQERAEKQEQIAARLSLPKTADFFEVSTADLEHEGGRFVVYSNGHALEPFSGRFKVAMRNSRTFRHAWTPEWSEWIDYRDNDGAVRYRQPETLEWWTGNDNASRLLAPAETWVMETCWQARVVDPVLGLTELEPVCVTAEVGMRAKVKSLEGDVRRLKDAVDGNIGE